MLKLEKKEEKEKRMKKKNKQNEIDLSKKFFAKLLPKPKQKKHEK